MRTPIQRIFEKVEVAPWDQCWPFRGALTKDGFGRISGGERGKPDLRVNRVIYAHFSQAPVPDDMIVQPICERNDCCNFKHMRLIPRNQNVFGSKLSESDVIQIFHSPDSVIDLSKKYDVTIETIRAIKRGDTWKKLARENPH